MDKKHSNNCKYPGNKRCLHQGSNKHNRYSWFPGNRNNLLIPYQRKFTAVFFGVVVFGESLTLRLGCGMLMIILAVTLIIAGGNVTIYLVRFRKLFPRLPIKRKK